MIESNDFSFLWLVILSGVLVRLGFDRSVFDNIPKLLFNLCFPALVLITFADMGSHGILEPDALAISAFAVVYTLAVFVTARRIMRPYGNAARKELIVFNMILGNITFVGLPFISYFFGVWGLRLAILFGVVQDFFIWSLCYWMFAQKGGLRQTLKTVLNPCFVAIVTGFVLAGAQLELPAIISTPIGMLAGMTVPLALLCIGGLLAQNTGILARIDCDIMVSIAVKSLLMPAAVFAILTALNLDPTLVKLCTLITALPTGLLSVIFAKEFNKDIDFAKTAFVISTCLFILICVVLYFALPYPLAP